MVRGRLLEYQAVLIVIPEIALDTCQTYAKPATLCLVLTIIVPESTTVQKLVTLCILVNQSLKIPQQRFSNRQ